MVGDAELLSSARTGDAASLGALLERYRPRLHAIALRELGFGPEAEDAVHDALLTALRRLGDLRDPSAVRSWLDAIVRNTCRMYHRSRRREVVVSDVPERAVDAEIDRHSLRDWVWGALDALPEASRVAAMLRYFGSYPSYEEIAEILAVPIGTVRSRLSEARAQLSRNLLSEAADEGSLERRESRVRRWEELWHLFQDKGDRRAFLSQFLPDVAVVAGGKRFGREKLEEEVDGDLETGTRTVILRTLAGGNVTIFEGRFINPREQPFRCPPGAAFVLFHRGESVKRIHFHMAARPPVPV